MMDWTYWVQAGVAVVIMAATGAVIGKAIQLHRKGGKGGIS